MQTGTGTGFENIPNAAVPHFVGLFVHASHVNYTSNQTTLVVDVTFWLVDDMNTVGKSWLDS